MIFTILGWVSAFKFSTSLKTMSMSLAPAEWSKQYWSSRAWWAWLPPVKMWCCCGQATPCRTRPPPTVWEECTPRSFAMNRSPPLYYLPSTSAHVDSLATAYVFQLFVDQLNTLKTEKSKGFAAIAPMRVAQLFGVVASEWLMEGVRE